MHIFVLMKLSVIIPAYNAADRLGAALAGVCGKQGVEVLVVDDGSSDSTSTLAFSFEGVIVIRQANGGVSSARNRGLDAASGEYVAFLDDDDALDLQKLSLQNCPQADIVVLRSFVGEKEKYPWGATFKEGCTYSPEDLLSGAFLRGSACGVLFRKDFLNDKGIRFAEGVRLGEDTVFFAEALSKAKSIAFSDVSFYLISPRVGSASRSFSEEDIASYSSAINAAEERISNTAIRNYVIFKLIIMLTSRAAALKLGASRTKSFLRQGLLPLSLDGIPAERAKIRILNLSYSLFYRLIALRDRMR